MSGRAASRCVAWLRIFEPLVQPAGVEVRRTEAEINVGTFLSGLHDALELGDRGRGLPEIEQGQAEVVVGLRRRVVDLQSLLQELLRTLRVLELPLDLAEQRQELRVPWHLGVGGLQLLARALVASELHIDVREVEPRRDERRIE